MRGLPRLRAAPCAYTFCSSGCAAEQKAAVACFGALTDVAGTLGSLVAAPGLMIAQKSAIKRLGGGERTEKHSSADLGSKES